MRLPRRNSTHGQQLQLMPHVLPDGLPSGLQTYLASLHNHINQFLQLKYIKIYIGISLVVQWLRIQASTAGGMDLLPGWGTKIVHATWCSQYIYIYTHTYIYI